MKSDNVKVFAYITKRTKLLLFVERGFPEGSVQVPAGSLEGDETYHEAVLREAREETGLEEISINCKLGETYFDNSIYGLDRIDYRVFFHLICNQDTPDYWSYEEKYPSIRLKDTPKEIIFDFFWSDLRDNMPKMQLGHDAFISKLKIIVCNY